MDKLINVSDRTSEIYSSGVLFNKLPVDMPLLNYNENDNDELDKSIM